jgi:endonuclease VIII
MPEGDSIFRAARALHKALSGRTITRFESMFPAVNRCADDRAIVGRSVDAVLARGKHLLMHLSGGLTLHTHMRMHGSWHLYRPGERWQRPARDMRILIETPTAVAIGFNVPIAELLTARDLARHPALRALGPDLLAGMSSAEHARDERAFDRSEALRRLRMRSGDAIADALLDQRVVAGIGNVFKSEILFLAGVDPFTMVAGLSDERLERIVDIAREQLAANVTLPAARWEGRRTTRFMNPSARLWVYGRGGKPCRRCGAMIQSRKTGVDARLTYWCPVCQKHT